MEKILRIRPAQFDKRYTREHMKPWKIKARGKVYEPAMKTVLPPFSFVYKKRAYSSNRILFPLKREDWDPNGERNPQNRGKSKFVRISWDEATDLIAAELKRKGVDIYVISSPSMVFRNRRIIKNKRRNVQ